jgi:hypothetical protein
MRMAKRNLYNPNTIDYTYRVGSVNFEAELIWRQPAKPSRSYVAQIDSAAIGAEYSDELTSVLISIAEKVLYMLRLSVPARRCCSGLLNASGCQEVRSKQVRAFHLKGACLYSTIPARNLLQFSSLLLKTFSKDICIHRPLII